jgi:hypothetical protein
MNNEDKLIELIQSFKKKLDDEAQEAEKHRDEYANLYKCLQFVENLTHDLKRDFLWAYFETLVGKYVQYQDCYFHLSDIDNIRLCNNCNQLYIDILEDAYQYDNGEVYLFKELSIYDLRQIQIISEEDFNAIKKLYPSDDDSKE